ncbi:uncharacterized protein BdWA1_004156, partial [Babesia duncani]
MQSELNEEIEIQFDNRVLSLPAGSSCSIKVSLEAKIGLVGVKKPVADVDEENKNGSESESDLLEEVLKELIEPTLNATGEEKNKMDQKRMNIINEIKKCQDCSEHNCYLKDKFLKWLKEHCDCNPNREELTQAIQDLSKKCKGKKCCNESKIKTAVQKVIDDKCQCTKKFCCFKNISNGADLAVEKTDKATEQGILKNIAKAIFNYYKPPEPKTTGFIVLNSCKSKTLTLCPNNDGNGQNPNERICVSSNNLKIYKEAFTNLKATGQVFSGL